MDRITVFLVDNEGFVFQYTLENEFGSGSFYAENRNSWYENEEYEGSPLNPDWVRVISYNDGTYTFRYKSGTDWLDRDDRASIPGCLEGGEFVTFSADEAEEVAKKRKEE
ncbi:hypothetical protein [Mahella australiensis]|uniref:Uncharacterized protein n=1 Tax=Mahella australiensis (strain DSM 15567 / CIP 107919 / 50-1 BON) TaxID=697281 RepID=F3ZZY7_MAHA5|nr:hypothetical protein [Mahella australiensis]AEE95805.1 hypothetical protein Mahau_0602 [Mahella australiensis 50-1 BON]